MNQEILEYIKSQRISVLAIERPDGSVHAATIHFAHSENPFVFFFVTERGSRKCEGLLDKETQKASLVIGFDESNMKTFQADGEVKLVTEEYGSLFSTTYLGKFPDREKRMDDARNAFLVFIPTWWRFTDWTKPEGKLILTSTDKA
jgi:uncharacterized protein YhbP (UPF0306 family)